MRTRFLLLLALGLLIVLPSVASAYAGYYWIQYQSSLNPVWGNYVVNGGARNGFYAGPWDAWYDSGKAQYRGNLYCVEANVTEATGGFHKHDFWAYNTDTYTPPGGTVHGMKWAAYLFRNVNPLVQAQAGLTGQKNRSALQLAIWEALYDGGASGYLSNLSAGNFYVSGNLQTPGGFTSTDVKNQAAAYLSTYQQEGQARWLHDGQDLLDVPEPGSLLLLGGTLLGPALLALRRRRSS